MSADAPPQAEGSERIPEPRRQRATRKLFEGWQLGLLAVSLPLLSLWLALPRPVSPELVPLPVVDRRELRALVVTERARARDAEAGGLPFEVRAVGELVRRHGRASNAGDAEAAALARQDLRAALEAARRRHGVDALVALRALQTALFLAAAERFRESGEGDAELAELGGSFRKTAESAGWLDEHRRLALSESELLVLFRLRWTELVGALDDRALRLGLHEYRLYYRILLERSGGESTMDRDARRLSVVTALSRRDSEYPERLARGVLLYRLGQPAAAADEFLAHLAARPEGPFALRARNYALAALADAKAME